MCWFTIIMTVVSYVIQRSAQQKAASNARRKQEEQQREERRQADLLAAQSRGVLLNVEANDSPIPVVYGRRRVGGGTCLKEASGSSNENLHKVVELCEGEIRGVMNYYLDNVISTDSRFAGVATLESHSGTDSQAASAALIAALPAKWTSAHQGKGVAYVYGAFTWSDTAWQGEPTITCDVLGRLLYDPRDGGTRFSNNPALAIRDYLTNARYGRGIASSAIDDDSFIAAANFCDERVACPAHTEVVSVVAATDLLVFDSSTLFGLGDGVSFEGTVPGGLIGGSPTHKYYYIPITESTGKLAASYSDALAYLGDESPTVSLDITSGDGSPQFTLSHVDQARHQLDGVVDVEQTPLDNVGILMSACDGYLIYSAGQYKLKCDQAEAASGFAFTEDNILGSWKIQLASRRDRLNRVTARFFNPARQWQPDFAVFDSATYRTEDNELVLETELSLPYTANVYRALRYAQLQCRQSRLGIQARFRATVDALRCEVGDVVAITHSTPGWVAKLFRIDALELRPDDEVDVFVSEYDSGAYDLDALTAVRTAPVTNLPSPFGRLDIDDLVATSGTADLLLQGDGTIVPRVRLRWTQPSNTFIKEYELQVDRGSVSPTEWADCPKVLAPATEGFALPVNDGEAVNLRIRARTTFGNAGDWAYVYGHTVIGKTEVPSDVPSITAVQSGDTVVVSCAIVDDVDLDYIGVRFNSTDDWDSATAFENILRGRSATSGAIPPGDWYVLAKAFDTSGNESANWISTQVTVSSTGRVTLATQTNQPFSDGVVGLTNMVRHWTGVLTMDSQSLASSLGWEVFDQFVPDAYSDGYAAFPQIDTGADGPARVWSDVVSTLGPGETAGTGGTQFQADYKTAAGSYDGYEDWTVGSAQLRYAKGRIHVETAVHGLPVVSSAVVHVDADTQEENGTVTVGAGGSQAATFTTAFRSAPALQVTPVGSGDVTASYSALTSAGFTAYFKTGGAAGAGTVSYTAKGA